MVLFGSHAEGAGREESDIDVAVISGDFSAQSFWERVRILPDAIYEVGLPIEAVALSPEEWERADRPIVVLLKRGRRSTDSMSLFGGHDGVAFGGGVPGRG
jgi:predicted nucleotidyltransferase